MAHDGWRLSHAMILKETGAIVVCTHNDGWWWLKTESCHNGVSHPERFSLPTGTQSTFDDNYHILDTIIAVDGNFDISLSISRWEIEIGEDNILLDDLWSHSLIIVIVNVITRDWIPVAAARSTEIVPPPPPIGVLLLLHKGRGVAECTFIEIESHAQFIWAAGIRVIRAMNIPVGCGGLGGGPRRGGPKSWQAN